MALIKCPQCEGKVSSTADACPKCGYKITEEDRQKALDRAKAIAECLEYKGKESTTVDVCQNLDAKMTQEDEQKAPNVKPWYKKWWGTAIIVVVGFFALIIFNMPGNTPKQTKFDEGFIAFYDDDYETAFKIFEEEMALGNNDAKAMLGKMYITISNDLVKGASLIAESSAAHSPVGATISAEYLFYFFKKINIQSADEAVTIAYNMGHWFPAMSLATLHAAKFELYGHQWQDMDKALSYADEAMKRGAPAKVVADARENIKMGIFDVGLYALGAKDYETAFKAFEKGISLGDKNAEAMLGKMYVEGNFKNDTKKGLRLIQKAADEGSPYALTTLAVYYADGKAGFKKDIKTAHDLLIKANETDGWYHLIGLVVFLTSSNGQAYGGIEKAVEYVAEAKKKGTIDEEQARILMSSIKKEAGNPNIALEDADDTEDIEADYYTVDKDHHKIINERFQFSIIIPKSWRAFESANNDGFFIKCDNPNVNIGVYGAYDFDGFSESEKEDISSDDFSFRSGIVGWRKLEPDSISFAYSTNDRIITMHVEYKGEENWYKKNLDKVLSSAGSLRDAN